MVTSQRCHPPAVLQKNSLDDHQPLVVDDVITVLKLELVSNVPVQHLVVESPTHLRVRAHQQHTVAKVHLYRAAVEAGLAAQDQVRCDSMRQLYIALYSNNLYQTHH